MQFTRFAALALVAATTGLAACSDEASQAPAAAADALPLEVSNARLMLPAVAGNPAAVYFDVKNTGDRNYAIRKAAVEGAGKTDLHGSMQGADGQMMMDGVGQVLVATGKTESFKPGGFHVMAFDLDPKLVAGGKTDMTLTVVGGKTLTVPVEIRAAGDER